MAGLAGIRPASQETPLLRAHCSPGKRSKLKVWFLLSMFHLRTIVWLENPKLRPRRDHPLSRDELVTAVRGLRSPAASASAGCRPRRTGAVLPRPKTRGPGEGRDPHPGSALGVLTAPCLAFLCYSGLQGWDKAHTPLSLPSGSVVKNLPANQCRRCRFHPWVGKIPLEEETATHSCILAWEIPWTGACQSVGSQKSRTQLSN